MKKTFRIFGVVLALLFGVALAQQGPFGNWQGEIGPDIIDLSIFVTLEGTPGEASGMLSIPVQGLFDFPLGDVMLDGDAISFTMPGIPGDPVFEGTLDADRIDGTFTQGGQPLPFYLERTDEVAAAPVRPQEPQPPFPYRSQEVRYGSGSVTLAGTLTLPEGEGPFAALLLITGSGAQDRNEELVGHKPFLLLADQLTRADYAVLRVDDRGVGGSSGSDPDASYADLLADVLAGIRFLAAHGEVDAGRIGLLGHSQGGYLAPAAAVASDRVAFVIMLAGPAVDGIQVLDLQNELLIARSMRVDDPGITEAEIDAAVGEQLAFLHQLYPLLISGDFDGASILLRHLIAESIAHLPEAQQPSPEEVAQYVALQVEGTINEAFRAFLVFDPQPLLRQLTVPVLAIYGTLDVQVDAVQSEGPLLDALEAAGNTDYTVEVFEGLNHLMQPATTGLPDEYVQIETTIDPAVLQVISDWLQARF